MSVEIKTKEGSIHFLLDEYMKRYNMGVGDLADLLNKKYNQALNIKNGNLSSLSFEVLSTICNHFGCQPGQLLNSNILTDNSIVHINRERKLMDANALKDLGENPIIKVDVHLIYALEGDYVIFACPEVEIYGDFIFPKNLNSIEDATTIVIEHFKDAFSKEKQKFLSHSEFLLRMQQRQHWILKETSEVSYFKPMPLTYYIENYYLVNDLINKHKALIIQIPLEIKI
jgi:DNA-binding Xre family transcriptional regulator